MDKILTIRENKKAYHDYVILEKLEVGIQLSGSEVKSIAVHKISIDGAYIAVLKGELWLVNSNISPYSNGGYANHQAIKNRKLLCHKKELRELKFKTEAKGFTIVPLKVYMKNGKFKLEIGIAKGKNKADKRQTLKNSQIERDIKRY